MAAILPVLGRRGLLAGGAARKAAVLGRGPRTWYIDPDAGDDGNDGRTDSTPKQTYAALYPLLRRGDTVLRKSGAEFADGFTAPYDALTLGTYGGSDAIVHNGLLALGDLGTGVEVNATDGVTPEPSSGLWRYDLTDIWNEQNRIMLVFDRAASTLPHEVGFETGWKTWYKSSLAAMTTADDWRQVNNLDGTLTIWVKSVADPTSRIEVNGPGYGVDARNKKITISGAQHIKGFENGYAYGGGSALTDATAQFICQGALEHTNSGGVSLTRCGGYDVGRTSAGDTGSADGFFMWTGTDATCTATFADCFADNVKEDVFEPLVTVGSVTVDVYTSASACNRVDDSFGRYTTRDGENIVDMKPNCRVTFHPVSGSEVEGAYLETGAGGGPVTVQRDARRFKMSGGEMNNTEYNGAAASAAEMRTYLDLDHVGIYSINACVLSRYTGQTSVFAFNLMVSNPATSGKVISYNEGGFAGQHNSIISLGSASTRQAVNLDTSNRAGNCSAIEQVTSTPDDDGYLTYRIKWTLSQNYGGEGAMFIIAGLTGDSAALNGLITITDSYPKYTAGLDYYYSDFKVLASADPPATVDKTGLTLNGVPDLQQLDGNLMIGTGDVFRVNYADSLTQSSYGANCVNDTITSERPVQMQFSKRYTIAQMKADPGVAGTDLKPDTSDKLGGAAWRGNYTSTYTERWAQKSVSALAVADEWATATCTGHGWSTGRRVCIDGSSIATATAFTRSS